jgi:lipopolysaccharide export system protein LptA
MDENLSWKIILIASIFSLIVMGVVYYYISPPESEYFTEEKMEKIAEFKHTRVSGRKKGKKVWEFFAEEGWTSKNRNITHLYDVSKGEIFQEGKPVVTDLRAPYAKAFRHSEIIEVFGHPEGKAEGPTLLNAYINLGRISKSEREDRREWSKLKANYLKYIPKDKRSEIKGKVELHKKDTSIYAQKIIVDHDENVADISEEIRLKRKDGALYSNTLKYLSNKEKLEAAGQIKIRIIENRLKTNINSERASFYTDINKDMQIQGNLEVAQGKKLAVAEEGVYSQREKELYLKGKVKAVFEKASVILREQSVKNLKSPEAKKILMEKTVLTSNELIFSTRTGDASAAGSVFVTQKGREAKSEQAVYDERTEIMTLTGNVYMKKENEWVKAEKVIISVKDESFEAVGAVEAEFKL